MITYSPVRWSYGSTAYVSIARRGSVARWTRDRDLDTLLRYLLLIQVSPKTLSVLSLIQHAANQYDLAGVLASGHPSFVELSFVLRSFLIKSITLSDFS